MVPSPCWVYLRVLPAVLCTYRKVDIACYRVAPLLLGPQKTFLCMCSWKVSLTLRITKDMWSHYLPSGQGSALLCPCIYYLHLGVSVHRATAPPAQGPSISCLSGRAGEWAGSSSAPAPVQLLRTSPSLLGPISPFHPPPRVMGSSADHGAL